MPVKRRCGKRRRQEWNDHHRHALATGYRFFWVFNGHREPWPMDEARTAWADLREGIMAEWAEQRPTLRPWGWWTIDHGIEPPYSRAEQRHYLRDHGHLTADELATIDADPSLLVLHPPGEDSWRLR